MNQQILDRLLKYEGGHTKDPDDPGGETYCGISRRWNGTWQGWKFVDASDAVTAKFWVTNFYSTKWVEYGMDKLKNNIIAEPVFDFAINCGVTNAVKGLQAALNRCGQAVSIDCKIGPQTIAAVEHITIKANEPELLEWLAVERIKRYIDVVNGSEKLRKFMDGWIKRAVSHVC